MKKFVMIIVFAAAWPLVFAGCRNENPVRRAADTTAIISCEAAHVSMESQEAADKTHGDLFSDQSTR